MHHQTKTLESNRVLKKWIGLINVILILVDCTLIVLLNTIYLNKKCESPIKKFDKLLYKNSCLILNSQKNDSKYIVI